MTSPSPPLSSDDIRNYLHHLEIVYARLQYHQYGYFSNNEEFWSIASRLTRPAPPGQPEDESASFLRNLLLPDKSFQN